MKKAISWTMLAMLLGVFALSGCASKTTKKIDTLQSQLNAVTDEIVRLDQSLQDTRSAIQSSSSTVSSYPTADTSYDTFSSYAEESAPIGAIYRTPSGFEIPAVNIQKALKKAGYYQGAIDGKVGPGTRDAIRAFQKDNGMTADGICGRQTWSKLKNYLDAIK